MNDSKWWDISWNPITGCTPCSPGCLNCYAARMAKRLAGRCGYPKDDPFRVTFHPDKLKVDFGRKPKRIFVCSMGDLFHENVTDEMIYRVLDATTTDMLQPSRHTFLLLTKRPQRMAEFFKKYVVNVLPNIFLGVTVCNQPEADIKLPILLSIPGFKKWVSIEPILEPVKFYSNWLGLSISNWIPRGADDFLDWVVAGSETGPGARPADLDWFRSLRYQCLVAEVPFFMKQTTGPTPGDLMIKEFPK